MNDPCTARIVLAYDGSSFHGWQVQPGLRTVQGELMRALKRIIPLDGIPPGAGRTDAGVHARGQVSSVEIVRSEHFERAQRALPRLLPKDMAIVEIIREREGFHARHDARGRSYSYRFMEKPDPLRRWDHLRLRQKVDFEAMHGACSYLLGEHECDSLCRAASLEAGKTRCIIHEAGFRQQGESWIFEIRADRFLHSMVRTIVGTLLEIGRGKRRIDAFSDILPARDRTAAGPTAPPHGLCLEAVEYEATSFAKSGEPDRPWNG